VHMQTLAEMGISEACWVAGDSISRNQESADHLNTMLLFWLILKLPFSSERSGLKNPTLFPCPTNFN